MTPTLTGKPTPRPSARIMAIKPYKPYNKLTTPQLSRLLGLNRDVLNQWVSRGFIAPTIPSTGSGNGPNLWGKNAIDKVRAFKSLVDWGIRHRKAADLADEYVIGSDSIVFQVQVT